MAAKFLKAITSLELEEQILNAGSLVALVGVFLPWAGGEWLGGDPVTYAGFRFYTGYMGLAIIALHLAVLLITIVPLAGGPQLVRRRSREIVRLVATSQATILILAALSVLAKTTMEFARMELRFGIYVSLIGSLVAVLYSFLRYQEQHRKEVQELFHHPDDEVQPAVREIEPTVHIPPPPPPPSEPEEHRLHGTNRTSPHAKS